MDDKMAVSTIERWYKMHCDGTWEHHLGITIETTDNPGWLVTFRELRLSLDMLADVAGEFLRAYRAQVTTDGTMVRVFAPSLQQVLVVAAILAHRSIADSAPEGRKGVKGRKGVGNRSRHRER
jgi:hypothetical protein